MFGLRERGLKVGPERLRVEERQLERPRNCRGTQPSKSIELLLTEYACQSADQWSSRELSEARHH